MGDLKSRLDIVTLGYIFQEMIEYPHREAVGPLLGGTVSYSAVALGRMGARVGIVSNVGPDTDEDILMPFRQAGVDMSGLNVRTGASVTKDVLSYDESGDKVITYLTRAPRISVTDIPQSYHNANLYYLCPVEFEIELDTVRFLRDEVGGKIAADLGGLGGAHTSPQMRKRHMAGKERFTDFIHLLSYVKASMEDCLHLFDGSVDSPAEALDRLKELGTEIAVITLGGDGALVCDEEGRTHRFDAFPASVVDTTGAGDTFMAAFLFEYLNTYDVKRSGSFATAVASLLIEKSGGVTLDRVPEIGAIRSRLAELK